MLISSLGLFSAAEKTAEFVVSTRLLAHVAERQFAQQELARGSSTWDRPEFLSLNGWLRKSWTEARYSGREEATLLSATQELHVWKSVIEGNGNAFFQTGAASRLAVNAARLITEWEIPLEDDRWETSEDTRQFRKWYLQVRELCKRNSWLCGSELLAHAAKWRGKRQAPVFFSDKDLSPKLKEVFRSVTYERKEPPKYIETASFESFEQELIAAARWARGAFESDIRRSVAVFVPDLRSHRAAVERAFSRTFYGPNSSGMRRAFSLSRSGNLAEQPFIAGALVLLQLRQTRIPIGAAGAVLRSSWVAGAREERSARALADLKLRKRRELDVSLADIEFASRDCPRLQSLFPKLRQILYQRTVRKTFARWSESIARLLSALGWPGDEELTPSEQESFQSWKDVLSQLSALSLVSPEVGIEDALIELRLLLATPANAHDVFAPVQILDSKEAPGLRFDKALAIGLSEGAWPRDRSTSPLIPLALQRERGVPGSSAQSAAREQERILDAIFSSASKVAVTWSGRALASVAERSKIRLALSATWSGRLPMDCFKPAVLEEFADNEAPAYEIRADTVSGGVSLIKSQSQCPFKAWAEYRLGSRALESGCLGFDSRDRGGYLHRALDFVWRELRDRDTLRRTSAQDRQQIIEHAVREAVREDSSSNFHLIVTKVEIERLKAVIAEWLTIEAERGTAFEALHIEDELRFDFSGLPLRLRIDRVDRLPNGKFLLIDYKSGNPNYRNLIGERPCEPQLLVYAAALGDQVDGLFFASFKPLSLAFKGMSRERHFKGPANNIPKNWDGEMMAATRTVEKLATEFLGGYAAVDPQPNACTYCDQKPFCRIQELASKDEED